MKATAGSAGTSRMGIARKIVAHHLGDGKPLTLEMQVRDIVLVLLLVAPSYGLLAAAEQPLLVAGVCLGISTCRSMNRYQQLPRTDNVCYTVLSL